MKRKFTSALLGALLFSAFLISACKKELYNQEKIDPQRLKEIHSYKKDVKISTINLGQFKNNANLNALGSLKDILLKEKIENGIKVNSSSNIPFRVNTDSIKVLQVNDTKNYVFAIIPKYSRAVTFRNITVQESATGTTAQMTVYTPSKNWIRDWRAGKKTTFEGKIDVLPIDLNDLNFFPLTNIQNSKSQEKISGLKNPNRTSEDQYTYGCTTTNVWTEVPYQCGGYDKHWPWELCPFVGDQRPGYRWETKEVTNCSWIKTEPSPGNGGPGNTTPNPGDYDPCDEDLPEGYTPPMNTIDETPCDSTTQNLADTYSIQVSKDSINLKQRFDCFKDISNTGATYYVRLCTDIPDNNDPDRLTPLGIVGHSFVTITKSNGTAFVSQTFGFYPESQKTALFKGGPVPSMIGDNGQNEYNASVGMIITAQQFNDMLNTALNLARQKYDLRWFNCTNFAVDLFNSVRPNPISLPDWLEHYSSPYTGTGTDNFGATPNGLYKKIAQMKAAGDSNASINTLNGPKSTTCN